MSQSELNSVATLIVKPGGENVLEAAGELAAALGKASVSAGALSRLGPEAVDLPVGGAELRELRAIATETLGERPVDCVIQPAQGRRKRMLIADMDSTIISVECVDELADFIGVKDKVAAITEAAMRGELDFNAALEERVALLKGLDLETLERCYNERVRFTPGARALIATMGAHNAQTVLVSGGFTFFTERVAGALGFHRQIANVLGIVGGRLDGTVARPIVNAQTKLKTLIAERDRLGLTHAAVLAAGDGANDIPMIQEAGLGVAFRAKPKTQAAAEAAIRHSDLTALLYLQGYTHEEFRESTEAA